MSLSRALAAALLLALLPTAGQAEPPSQASAPEAGRGNGPQRAPVREAPEEALATWSFNWENDVYGGTDRNYTNGVRLSYVSPDAGPGGLHGPVAETLLFADGDDRIRYGLAVGHNIYTPVDTEVARPLPDQHPYAGWLYGEYSVFAQDADSLRMLGLQVGLVGPAAGGEWVQNNFHDIINSYQVRGWDNQLKNEPAFALMALRKDRALLGQAVGGLELDVLPHLGVTLGTLRTQASAGATLRFGDDLARDFGPPRIRPAIGGSGYFRATPGFNWYVFAGIEGRAVVRNLVLDGNTFRDSLSVEKEPLVGDIQAGVVLQYKSVQLAWTFVTRTREFEGQDALQQFGAVSLSAKF